MPMLIFKIYFLQTISCYKLLNFYTRSLGAHSGWLRVSHTVWPTQITKTPLGDRRAKEEKKKKDKDY